LFTDDRTIENDCAHAHQHFVADFAGVDNRAVADGNPIADEARKIVGEVQHGVVLDVRMVADDDAVDVAAQHRAIPHTGMRAEGHVTKDDSGFGEVNTFAELRFSAQEGVELFHRVLHAGNLTAAIEVVADLVMS